MKSKIWLVHLVALLAILGTLLPGGMQSQAIAAPPEQEPLPGIEIEPELQSQLMSDDASGYLIYFREYPDLSLAYDMNWEARGRFVVNALQQTAARTQKDVRAYLDARGTGYKAYWIDNVIVVDSSSMNTFNGLMNFTEIAALRARRNPILYEPVESAVSTYAPDAIELNITHVGADQVWALGYTGEGIVVANIDTGVRYTHQALVNQYRGNQGSGIFDHNYNWWDPALGGSDPVPNDHHSHGSHTMGTILGDDGTGNQIGMAPGAQWIACQAFEFGDDELLECGQFMAAPWDLNQANANSDLRPHVVNNSWGDCLQYADHWYDGVITSWHALGIYPVFSNGNASNCGYPSPPGLNTVGNPARAGNLTGVGSTGRDNGQYATHSNWGPTDDPDTVNPRGYPDLKPQILAPGVSIRSAYKGSDTDYGTMSGTSMSSPHVTGLVALMWSAAPCLVGEYAATETIIEETATPIPYDDGTGGGAHVPNYATGWGEINALAAVQAAQEACGDFILGVTPGSQTICAPAEAVYNVDVTPLDGYNQPVTLSTLGEPAGTSVGFSLNPVTPLPGSSVLTIGNTAAAAVGNYSIDIIGSSTSTFTSTVELNIFDSVPGSVILDTPLDGALNQSPKPAFTWNAAAEASSYQIEIATDSGFGSVVDSAVVDVTSYTPGTDLNTSTVYYWRVKASNACGAGSHSPTWSFTTQAAPGACSPGTVPSLLYSEDFESGAPGWTHDGTGDTWALSTANVHSGSYAYHGVDMPSVTDQRLILPSGGVVLPTGQTPLTLQFWNYQSLEDSTSGCFDGGVLEISTDSGVTWTQLPTGNMLTDPYDGSVSTSYSNPLAGEDAWCGDPQDWLKSIVELDAYAGQTAQFRFRLGTDISFGHDGWDVDDVLVQSCVPAGYNFTFGPDSSINTAPKSGVTHTFTLSNLGLADTYTLTLTGGGWPAALLSTTPLAVGTGGAAQVEVRVDVPDLEGSDTFTVTAQSWGQPMDVMTATGSTQAAIVAGGLELTPPSQAHTGSPGDTITHSFVVSNTGNYTDTYDLVLSGNIWPTGLSGSAAVELSAGASAQVDVEVNIPSQLSSVIIASDIFTLTATSRNDGSATANATGTSNANVNPNVEMTPASQAQSGRPGEVVTHTYTITNTGDYTDTFGLSVSGDGWAANASADTGPLAAGESVTFDVAVSIPTALPPLEDNFALTAVSGLDSGVTAQVSGTTKADVTPNVEMTPANQSQSGDPGEVVTHTYTITNTGDYTDTFGLSVNGDGWAANAPAADTGPLAAGESVTLDVAVSIPTALPPMEDSFTLTAVSGLDSGVTAQVSGTTEADVTPNVEMTPANQSQSGDPGEVVTHTYTITNTGDYTDTFGLAVNGDGWAANAPADTGPLAAGESVTIDVAVSIPTALPPLEDSFTLTAVSGLDSGVTAQVSGTTSTTKWYKFYLPLILH